MVAGKKGFEKLLGESAAVSLESIASEFGGWGIRCFSEVVREQHILEIARPSVRDNHTVDLDRCAIQVAQGWEWWLIFGDKSISRKSCWRAWEGGSFG
jgi:hypothetical protein